jgi:hypothetical protein
MLKIRGFPMAAPLAMMRPPEGAANSRAGALQAKQTARPAMSGKPIRVTRKVISTWQIHTGGRT